MDARPGHMMLETYHDELKSKAALSRAVLSLIDERKRLLYRHLELTFRRYYEDKGEGVKYIRQISDLMGELQKNHGCIVRDETPFRDDGHHDQYRWIIYWGECPWCNKSISAIGKP